MLTHLSCSGRRSCEEQKPRYRLVEPSVGFVNREREGIEGFDGQGGQLRFERETLFARGSIFEWENSRGRLRVHPPGEFQSISWTQAKELNARQEVRILLPVGRVQHAKVRPLGLQDSHDCVLSVLPDGMDGHAGRFAHGDKVLRLAQHL